MTLPGLYCNISQNIGKEVINAELMKLWDWLGAIKLSLNIVKTKYMVFHTSMRNVPYPDLKVNNSNVERVTQFNFFGVILHSHMTWNKHINNISIKIARSIGILYRLEKCYTSSHPLLSLFVGVCYQRKPFFALAPKESSTNNY